MRRSLCAGCVVVIVAFVTAGIMSSAHASTSATVTHSLSTRCTKARNAFHSWLVDSLDEHHAVLLANRQWQKSSPYDLQGDALERAIRRYEAKHAKAVAKHTKAQRDLARFSKARAKCPLASMPSACRAEFATHQPLLDQVSLLDQQVAKLFESIQRQEDALRANDPVRALLDETKGQDEAIGQYNELIGAVETTLKPAYNDALDRCNDKT